MTTVTTPRRWISFQKAAGLLRAMIIDGSHEAPVLDKSAALCRGFSALNYPAQAFALWNYVRNGIAYLEDPRNDDHFQSPAVTMQRGAGDCDDQVILLGSLLRSIGFSTRLVFVFSAPPKDYSVDFPEHVFLEFNADRTDTEELWTCADTVPTPDDNGGFYYARFGCSFKYGFKEYVGVD